MLVKTKKKSFIEGFTSLFSVWIALRYPDIASNEESLAADRTKLREDMMVLREDFSKSYNEILNYYEQR